MAWKSIESLKYVIYYIYLSSYIIFNLQNMQYLLSKWCAISPHYCFLVIVWSKITKSDKSRMFCQRVLWERNLSLESLALPQVALSKLISRGSWNINMFEDKRTSFASQMKITYLQFQFYFTTNDLEFSKYKTRGKNFRLIFSVKQ